MSVLTFLSNTAREAKLSSNEQSSISRSIITLQDRLTRHFKSDCIIEHFQFGSSTRDTILPRKMDEHSDIDYIIVFRDDGLNPQAYLDRLRGFVKDCYSRSAIRQSNPTITLELNHIKFELVPATFNFWDNLRIPNKTGGWMRTDPNDFNDVLNVANKNLNLLLKPSLRLLKYWNARSNYPVHSFELETQASSMWSLPTTNLKENFFRIIDKLNYDWRDAKRTKDEVKRAKKIVGLVRDYEDNGMTVKAEKTIRTLFRLS